MKLIFVLTAKQAAENVSYKNINIWPPLLLRSSYYHARYTFVKWTLKLEEDEGNNYCVFLVIKRNLEHCFSHSLTANQNSVFDRKFRATAILLICMCIGLRGPCSVRAGAVAPHSAMLSMAGRYFQGVFCISARATVEYVVGQEVGADSGIVDEASQPLRAMFRPG